MVCDIFVCCGSKADIAQVHSMSQTSHNHLSSIASILKAAPGRCMKGFKDVVNIVYNLDSI